MDTTHHSKHKFLGLFMDTPRKQLFEHCCEVFPEIVENLDELERREIESAVELAIKKSGATAENYNDIKIRTSFGEMLLATVESMIYRERELRSSIPEQSLITNSNVANAIPGLRTDTENLVPVVHKGRLVAETKITVNILNDKNVRMSETITEYDKMAHDAICTLWASGNKTMTADMIYRAMNGFVETEKVSPKAIKSIENALRKMERTTIDIDRTEQFRAAGIIATQDSQAVISEKMINLRAIRVRTGGVTKTAYRILNIPIVYSYSLLEDQVLSVPRELLNTKDVLRSSESIMMIRYSLLRWIETMKRFPDESDNIIRYETLYNLLGNPSERQAKAAIRSNTVKLLDNYVKMNYIAGYSQFKHGAVIVGVKIQLNPGDRATIDAEAEEEV